MGVARIRESRDIAALVRENSRVCPGRVQSRRLFLRAAHGTCGKRLQGGATNRPRFEKANVAKRFRSWRGTCMATFSRAALGRGRLSWRDPSGACIPRENAPRAWAVFE